MPGDYDIEYTSPWAGANYLPYVRSSPLSHVMLILMLCSAFQLRKAVDGRRVLGQSLLDLLRVFQKLGYIFRVRLLCISSTLLLIRSGHKAPPQSHAIIPSMSHTNFYQKRSSITATKMPVVP
jgi:hypothetical protein